MSVNFTGGWLAVRADSPLASRVMATRPTAVEDDGESGKHHNCDEDDLLHENLFLAGTLSGWDP